MEEIKRFIFNYYPTVIEYVLIIVSYFFFFLYQSKVVGTKQIVSTLFKSGMKDMKATVSKAENVYNNATERLVGVDVRLTRLEKAMYAIIEEREVNDIVETSGTVGTTGD